MKKSGLFFWFFFALRAWAWNLKKAQSAPAFCLFSRKSHTKAFCLVKFRAKCARLALKNAPQKRPFITNFSVNFNANSAKFLLNFAYKFTNSHFKAY